MHLSENPVAPTEGKSAKLKRALYGVVHGPNHQWWALSVIAMGTFMATLSNSIINIGLPNIMEYFNASLTATEWVVLVYLLTTTALLLPAGRLSDLVGRKKTWILGLSIFTLFSAAAGASQTATQLIIIRGFQAVGAAMTMANGFALTATVFPAQKRGKAMGIVNAVAAIGVTSGPALGGLLLTAFGWRAIFYLNIPLGTIVVLMATLILREELVSTPKEQLEKHFDIPGALLLGVGITSLLVGLSFGQEGNWSSPWVRLALLVAFVSFIAFPQLELRRQTPLVDLRLLKNRLFMGGNIARLMSFMSISAFTLLMPFYLQLVLGYRPLKAGLLMTPATLAIAFVSPVSGWLANKVSPRILCSAGLAISSLAFFWLSTLSLGASYIDVLSPLILLGLGQGMFQAPNTTSIMNAVPRESLGITSGFLALMRQIGHSLGIATAGALVAVSMVSVVGHASLHGLRAEMTSPDSGTVLLALADGIGKAYFAAGVMSVIGIVASLVRGSSARAERGELLER
jgi:EmrB/QacA subfamily drug resistance transporter